jgi:flagellar biosynthesis protein FlhG
MSDQATELRKLVLRAMRDSLPNAGPAPRLMLFTTGQTGVGVTTAAVNLAVALSQQGARIVLVDADSQGTGIATLCGLNTDQTVADILVARRDIHEALCLGPAGIQVIPGLWRPGHEPEVSSMALERLMRQLTKLGRHADAVLLDVGNGANDLVRRLSQSADDVIVVTTPETSSVMDAYSRIKLTLSGHATANISVMVNCCRDERQSADVFTRIDQSCRRFLGHGVDLLGSVPYDADVVKAADLQSPYILARPNSAFAQMVQQMAVVLSATQHGNQSTRNAA